ncbi:VOC family protein [Celeribacter arenosi]|uniref:VOC domain-containing protein n=1 Tax=Celeribacter arenosi TaxID=792649 RepID=A0ABP7K9C0_9RHOB
MSNATQDALKRATINGFHHVAILARNLECAVEFYGVTLGLPALPLPPDLEACVCWFDLGDGNQLHVMKGEPSPDGRAHLALEVSSAQAWRDYLTHQEIEFYEPDLQIPGKARIFTTDPCGNLIELTEAPERR